MEGRRGQYCELAIITRKVGKDRVMSRDDGRRVKSIKLEGRKEDNAWIGCDAES